VRRTPLTTAAVLALALCASPARAQRVTEYHTLVREYAAGQGGDAVMRLARWSRDDVTAAVAATTTTLSSNDLPVAAMLHTELADAIVDTDPFGAAFHATTARAYLGAWIARPDGRERAVVFSRRWYEFVAGLFAGAGRLGDAVWYVRAGLLEFPADSMLYVVRGTIAQMNTRLRLVPDLRGPRPEHPDARSRIEELLKRATNAYQQAVDTDDGNALAWLHLGWINFYLEDKRAKSRFDAALARAHDDSVRYLAHLFLGGIAERDHQPADALREYESARLAGARYQTPYVAISRVEESVGHSERAREAALQGAQLRKDDDDPWWDFRIVRDRPALTWLRAEARRP
jgi:tetratricopeptide (TPR) repeat protein